MRSLNRAKNENLTEITTVHVRTRKEFTIAGAVFATLKAPSFVNKNDWSTRIASAKKICRTETKMIPVAPQRHARPKIRKKSSR